MARATTRGWAKARGWARARASVRVRTKVKARATARFNFWTSYKGKRRPTVLLDYPQTTWSEVPLLVKTATCKFDYTLLE